MKHTDTTMLHDRIKLAGVRIGANHREIAHGIEIFDAAMFSKNTESVAVRIAVDVMRDECVR